MLFLYFGRCICIRFVSLLYVCMNQKQFIIVQIFLVKLVPVGCIGDGPTLLFKYTIYLMYVYIYIIYIYLKYIYFFFFLLKLSDLTRPHPKM